MLLLEPVSPESLLEPVSSPSELELSALVSVPLTVTSVVLLSPVVVAVAVGLVAVTVTVTFVSDSLLLLELPSVSPVVDDEESPEGVSSQPVSARGRRAAIATLPSKLRS